MTAGQQHDIWELRREPDQGWGPIVRFVGWATWTPTFPVVGPVRWYRNGEPVGDVLDGYPPTG